MAPGQSGRLEILVAQGCLFHLTSGYGSNYIMASRAKWVGRAPNEGAMLV